MIFKRRGSIGRWHVTTISEGGVIGHVVMIGHVGHVVCEMDKMMGDGELQNFLLTDESVAPSSGRRLTIFWQAQLGEENPYRFRVGPMRGFWLSLALFAFALVLLCAVFLEGDLDHVHNL